MAWTTMKPRKTPRDFDTFRNPARPRAETLLVQGLVAVEQREEGLLVGVGGEDRLAVVAAVEDVVDAGGSQLAAAGLAGHDASPQSPPLGRPGAHLRAFGRNDGIG